MKRTLIQIKTTKEFKDLVLSESRKRNMTMTSFISGCVLRECDRKSKNSCQDKNVRENENVL